MLYNNASEELFNKFRYLGSAVTQMGCIVQNPGTVITEEDLKEWQTLFKKILLEIHELKKFTESQITELQEKSDGRYH